MKATRKKWATLPPWPINGVLQWFVVVDDPEETMVNVTGLGYVDDVLPARGPVSAPPAGLEMVVKGNGYVFLVDPQGDIPPLEPHCFCPA